MHRFSLTALPLILLAAAPFSGPVSAQDAGGGFSVSGNVQLEYYVDDNGSDESFGFLDTTIGWRSQGGGGLGFGVDLSLVAIENLRSGNDFNAVWGGLVVATGFGEVTLGRPRSLLETMIIAPTLGGGDVLQLELESTSGSFLELAGLAPGIDIYGVSFKGGSGGLSYGAAIHRLDGSADDQTLVELAAAFETGSLRFQGAFETFDTSGTRSDKILLGATFDQEVWSAGLLFARQDAGSTVTTTKVFGDYALSDIVTLGAQIWRQDTSGSDSTLYGLTAEFGSDSGAFGELGVVGESGDQRFNASVGYRF